MRDGRATGFSRFLLAEVVISSGGSFSIHEAGNDLTVHNEGHQNAMSLILFCAIVD